MRVCVQHVQLWLENHITPVLCSTCCQLWLLYADAETYLQVTDDAERLGASLSAGGGGRELVRSANQQVPCRRVAAALRAHVAELREGSVLARQSALLSAGEHLQG